MLPFNFSSIQLHSLALHRVGNKHRAESNFISENLYDPDAGLREALLKFFLKPLRKSNDQYHFIHDTDLQYNPMYGFARAVFQDPDRLLPESVNILYHLYKQSNHPNIKRGELFVAYFTDVQLADELIDAVGIFKSESKQSFLKIAKDGSELVMRKTDGIALEKLDKGCLILHTQDSDGYRVLSVDNNRYDANYWPRNFLAIDYVHDENFHTKVYLQLCDDFSKDVIAAQGGKQEQMQFLTDSVDYFSKHDTFNVDDFTRDVAPLAKFGEEFRSYQSDYNLQDINDFPISKPAVKSSTKKFGSLIKLDTGIQIRLNLNNPEASRQFLEKGFDETREMYFYKVYFNEEED